MVYRFDNKLFLERLQTFFQISLYFSKNSLSFIEKVTQLVLEKSVLNAFIFGRDMSKGLILLTSS